MFWTSLAALAATIALSVVCGEGHPQQFRYAHDGVPTAPNDVAVAERGATARTDSNPPRYHPRPMIDGDTWDLNGRVYTAWNSGKSPTPHWAEITFGRLETIDRVTIYWPVLAGAAHASARYTVEAWVDGKWHEVAKQSGPQATPSTTHTLPALTTRRVRICQPAGGGHAKTPNALWNREIEANAVGSIEPASLPPNLLKGPIRCTKIPPAIPDNRVLKREGASFISGCKAVVLASTRSGIRGKFRIYIVCKGQRDTSVQRDFGPIAPGGRARAVFDLLRDNIWTCATFQSTCLLYDAVFEGLQEEDRELIDFLHARNPEITSMADLRHFFEDNFIRVGVQAIIDSSVRGNEGAHQEAMMTAALVSGVPEATEIVDWVFTGEGQYRYKLANSFLDELLAADVYDAADWSVIIPLSQESVRNGSQPVEFPDFRAKAPRA